MKKHFFLSSFLLTNALFFIGCTQQTQIEPITPIQPSADYSTDTSTNNSEVDNQVNEPTEESTPTQTSRASTASGPSHQLKSIQGDNINIVENGNIGFDFPQYAGKIVIFQIFGKDCEFCVKELPIINQVKSEYAGKVKVVSIQAQDRMTPSEKSNLLNSFNIDYPVIEGNDARPLLRFITKTYGWRGILPYILILKDGATEYSFSDGGVSHQEFQESISSLL